MNNSRTRVFIPMLGKHSACNALAAIAVGTKLGVPLEEIVEGLAESDGPEMRLQLQNTGPITVVNDAYNANPNSMKAAIETIAMLPTEGRRVAVLGDMRELGVSSERYHREIGEMAATEGKLDLLFCIGEQSKFLAESAMKAGFPETAIRWYRDSATRRPRFPRN